MKIRRNSFHSHATYKSAEMLIKTVPSVNQLSLYRAVPACYVQKQKEDTNLRNTEVDNISKQDSQKTVLEGGRTFITRPAMLVSYHGHTTTCREYSHTRDFQNDRLQDVLGANTVSGPVWVVNVTRPFGRCCIEVEMDSVSGDNSQSWVVISRGVARYASEISAKQSQYVFWRIRPCPFWLRGNDSKHRPCNKIQGESCTTEKMGGQLSSSEDSSNLDCKPAASNRFGHHLPSFPMKCYQPLSSKVSCRWWFTRSSSHTSSVAMGFLFFC